MSEMVTTCGESVGIPQNPVAYKYADPLEDARWIYDEGEAREIQSEDPSLIVWEDN